MSVDIGIIGAMDTEIGIIVSRLENRSEEIVSGIKFYTGSIYGKKIVVAKCGIGKVFAAVCAEAMIIRYSPGLVVNTGVGGGLRCGIGVTDTVIAQRLVQHDMDTSALGDEKGLISGINKVFFDADSRAVDILSAAGEDLGLKVHRGVIASGDKFVASKAEKEAITDLFGASVCEMEGAAIAQVAFVNEIPFAVIRAVSDSADEESSMDYMKFLPIAAENSAKLTLALIEKY